MQTVVMLCAGQNCRLLCRATKLSSRRKLHDASKRDPASVFAFVVNLVAGGALFTVFCVSLDCMHSTRLGRIDSGSKLRQIRTLRGVSLLLLIVMTAPRKATRQ